MRDRIEQAVSQLVLRYATRSPGELCERLPVTVRTAELHGKIRGFFYCNERIKAIILAEELSGLERDFVLAHELGHVVLHPTVNTLFLREKTHCVAGRFEKEADLFAGILLLPRERQIGLAREGYTAGEISKISGVPLPIVEQLWQGQTQDRGNDE